MIRSIHTRSRVGADGVLHLDVASGCANAEVEVTVIVQPVDAGRGSVAQSGWSEDFLSEVVGGWRGEPLRREAQGEYEARDPL